MPASERTYSFMLLDHPAVRNAQHVELYCLPELEPFYEGSGFTAEIGGVRLLRRTQTPKSPQ